MEIFSDGTEYVKLKLEGRQLLERSNNLSEESGQNPDIDVSLGPLYFMSYPSQNMQTYLWNRTHSKMSEPGFGFKGLRNG